MYEEAIYFSKAALSFVNVQKLLSHDFRYFRYHYYFTICEWLYKNNCGYSQWLFSSKNRLSKWSSPTFEIFLLGPTSKRLGYLDEV